MSENPTIDKIVASFMQPLDETELLKKLISFSGLDAPAVGMAEALLQQGNQNELEKATKQARGDLEAALYRWVKTTADWLHSASSN